MVSHLTTESSALSIQAADVPDFVYFQQHVEWDLVRIGFTNGSGRREDRQDEFEPIAVIQATYDDEQRLHKHFSDSRSPRRRSNSVYEGGEVWGYVTWLLERGHAGRNRDEALRIPRLPWSVWGPQAKRNENHNGELSLFDELPHRDRVARARADYAHLSSESDEWYTPTDLIEAARHVMGSIDTDPASCIAAQERVRASQWYSKDQDGLRTDLPWSGNVWLNPPYGRGENSASAFVKRLAGEIHAGTVKQAITCLNLASTSAHWFDPVWDLASVHCVYRGRPNFWNTEAANSSPTKGIQLSYFGHRSREFAEAFHRFGRIVVTPRRQGLKIEQEAS